MRRFLFALPAALAVALGLLLNAAMSNVRVAAQPAAPVEAHTETDTETHTETHTAHPVSNDTRRTALDPALLAAADVVIEQSGFTFSPTVVTVEPGQTVTWVRRSGAHNVAADDGIRSGDVSSDWDIFSHTFTAVGESRYYCEQHGGPGGSGMSGMVIVQESGQSGSKLYLPLIAQ